VQDTDVGDDANTTERRGLDRRTLIKRAGIAGAAAWTAPVILDSLASPAGATTSCAGTLILNPLGATYVNTTANQSSYTISGLTATSGMILIIAATLQNPGPPAFSVAGGVISGTSKLVSTSVVGTGATGYTVWAHSAAGSGATGDVTVTVAPSGGDEIILRMFEAVCATSILSRATASGAPAAGGGDAAVTFPPPAVNAIGQVMVVGTSRVNDGSVGPWSDSFIEIQDTSSGGDNPVGLAAAALIPDANPGSVTAGLASFTGWGALALEILA
jgi:hypothetical protein